MRTYITAKLFILIFLFSLEILNAQPIYKFAVIGDFGDDNQAEADVAALVNSWGVDFIVTVGDNFYGATDGNYSDSWQALDTETGKYFHNWIKPYLGSYGSGSPDINRFFPALGNHDWYHLDSSKVYEDYFDLTPYSSSSGNERYYDFVWENIHFFVLSTYGNGLTEYTFPRHNNYGEPDGVVQNSIQAQWLQQAMQNADPSHWKIVVTHHPPYSSSSEHGSEPAVRWPFKDWGADLVLCGHDHTYERLSSDGLTYIVNGLGGESIYPFGSPVPESQFRYNDDYGAMLCQVYADSINFNFISRTGLLIDNYNLIRPIIPVELKSFFLLVDERNVRINWVTVTETNNSGFEIERNSGYGYEVIKFIEGNGTTTELNHYSYSDLNLNPGFYSYRLKQIDFNGNYNYSKEINTSIFNPQKFILEQNYPNPFNPTTTIKFTMPEAGNVRITLFNILGQEVKTLVNGFRESGVHTIDFNASDLNSGIYIYKIKSGSFVQTKKMTLLK
jgi:tartrate-resistant acid phosphatase type 5